ncbi:MAG: DsbA family protein [Candidatus Electrothrix sp. YB6]
MENTDLKIISFTDPYCTWCWGSEPILRKIQEIYGVQVSISFVMGGLVEDMRNFSDPSAGIGGELWYKKVAEHWVEASGRHKMPVDEQVFFDMKNDVFSTYPACIAFKAAQFQGEESGNRYLRRLREAAAAERLVIQLFDVQVKLAEEVGLDRESFVASIHSGQAEQAFREDLAQCRQQGIQGFPSFLVRGFGEEILLRGYTPYQTFDRWVQELLKNQLTQHTFHASSSQVFDFISRYGKVAPMEVACVYDMTFEDAQTLLQDMAASGLVSEQQVGNGAFYVAAQDTVQCDPVNGSCAFKS